MQWEGEIPDERSFGPMQGVSVAAVLRNVGKFKEKGAREIRRT